MQNDRKSSGDRRIDLSNCKLLLPYGRNAVDSLKYDVKVGAGVKVGLIGKPGILIRPDAMR